MKNQTYEAVLFSSVFTAFLVFSSSSAAQEYSRAALDCYSAASSGAENLIQLCQIAADAEDAHAMYLLAQRSNIMDRRIELLKKAVAQKHLHAMAMLARIRWNSGERDKAIALERTAAQLGHGPSRIAIANRMRRAPGDNIKLLAQARQILLGEAQKGYPLAQFHLAQMMREGDGGPVNLEGARRWLSSAAASGLVQAQFNLGMALLQDQPGRAANWLVRAAHAGHSGAMLRMATLYTSGRGIKRNPAQANKWVHLAIRSGHPQGVQVLSSLDQGAAGQAQRKTKSEGAQQHQQESQTPSPEVNIMDVQRALAGLGYGPGFPDGIFGAKTRIAIEKFESHNELPVTGVPTPMLLKQLKSKLSGH